MVVTRSPCLTGSVFSSTPWPLCECQVQPRTMAAKPRRATAMTSRMDMRGGSCIKEVLAEKDVNGHAETAPARERATVRHRERTRQCPEGAHVRNLYIWCKPYGGVAWTWLEIASKPWAAI